MPELEKKQVKNLSPEQDAELQQHLLGCDPDSNELPEGYPFHGGNIYPMIRWYVQYAGLISRDIASNLDYKFKDLYTNYDELYFYTLAAGMDYSEKQIIKAFKSLASKNIIDIVILPYARVKYRLTKLIEDSYTKYYLNV